MRTSMKSIATHTFAAATGASLGAAVVGFAALSGGSLRVFAYRLLPQAVREYEIYKKQVAGNQRIDLEVEFIWPHDPSKLSVVERIDIQLYQRCRRDRR